jgi:hypothetical protein
LQLGPGPSDAQLSDLDIWQHSGQSLRHGRENLADAEALSHWAVCSCLRTNDRCTTRLSIERRDIILGSWIHSHVAYHQLHFACRAAILTAAGDNTVRESPNLATTGDSALDGRELSLPEKIQRALHHHQRQLVSARDSGARKRKWTASTSRLIEA